MSAQHELPTTYTGPDGSIIQLLTWERDGVIWGLHYDTIAVGDHLLYDHWNGEYAEEVPIVVTSLDHPCNVHRANGKVIIGAGLPGHRAFRIIRLRRPDGQGLTPLITAEEAANLLDVSPTTIRSYVKRQKLHGTKRGRDWFFTRAEVARLKAAPPQRTGRPPQG